MLCIYTVIRIGGCVDRELSEQVMIARLTTESVCQDREREIALNLIAEIARGNLMKNNDFSVFFFRSAC